MFKYTVSLIIAFTLFVTGCGGDDANDWVGTWTLQSVDGESYDQAFEDIEFLDDVKVSIVTNDWTFTDDGKVDAEVVIKMEGQEDGVDFSAQVSTKVTGTYTLSGDTYTLTLNIRSEGNVTSEGEILDQGDIFEDDYSDSDSGTWERNGSTLTLTDDEESTIIFKKK